MSKAVKRRDDESLEAYFERYEREFVRYVLRRKLKRLERVQ